MKRKNGTKPPQVLVAVNPDGTVYAVFNNSREAAKIFPVTADSINRWCFRNNIGYGKKWFYEKDFRQIYMNCEIEKLQFTLPEDYLPGRSYLRKGHKHGNGWEKRSEEDKQKTREHARERALKLNASKANLKGAKPNKKPVVCVTDGRVFPSISEAADYYGMPRNHVAMSLYRMGTTRGMKFRLKSIIDNIKDVI